MSERATHLSVESDEREDTGRQYPLSPANQRPAEYRPRERKCLSCKTMFNSEWSGERICKKCKGSHTWRSGLP